MWLHNTVAHVGLRGIILYYNSAYPKLVSMYILIELVDKNDLVNKLFKISNKRYPLYIFIY